MRAINLRIALICAVVVVLTVNAYAMRILIGTLNVALQLSNTNVFVRVVAIIVRRGDTRGQTSC